MDLEKVLKLMREHGVQYLKQGELTVWMGEAAPKDPTPPQSLLAGDLERVKDEAKAKQKERLLPAKYDDESLFPDGRPSVYDE